MNNIFQQRQSSSSIVIRNNPTHSQHKPQIINLLKTWKHQINFLLFSDQTLFTLRGFTQTEKHTNIFSDIIRILKHFGTWHTTSFFHHKTIQHKQKQIFQDTDTNTHSTHTPNTNTVETFSTHSKIEKKKKMCKNNRPIWVFF